VAREHGKNGRVLIAIASGGTAEPLPFVAQWSADFSTDMADVTAMGDSNHVVVAGLPKASGSFSGFFDGSTNQTYSAAVDGVARKFYLYPDFSITTTYWHGTVNVDFKIDSSVTDAVKMSANWAAASAMPRVG
jgi:hypothetical protein